MTKNGERKILETIKGNKKKEKEFAKKKGKMISLTVRKNKKNLLNRKEEESRKKEEKKRKEGRKKKSKRD